MGSSLAALLCYFTMAVTCYLVGQRYYPIPYTVAKDMGYILVTCLLILAVSHFTLENLWANLGLDIIVILIFCSVIFLIERRGLTQPRA